MSRFLGYTGETRQVALSLLFRHVAEARQIQAPLPLLDLAENAVKVRRFTTLG